MRIPNSVFSFLARVTGKNSVHTPAKVIIDQMNEPRPLPMGMKKFDSWASRIIKGACIPGGEDEPEAFRESQIFTLANMLMHLGPTESHKPDAFFIHSLRKCAINQVADSVRKDLHTKAKARTAEKEAAEKTEAQNASEIAAQSTLERAAANGAGRVPEVAAQVESAPS